jgi:5'-nucleotidase
MNEGGIRASIPGPAGTDGPRQVSYGDLYKLLPFANQVTVITMTGDMIRRLLEQQFPSEGGPYILQVSDGFTYRYKLHAPAGQHVVTGSIALHGRPIAPADQVRVEANDFLAAGSEGFTVFREGSNPYVGPIDIDALVEYFGAHSPVAPGLQNRIVRVD